MYIGEYKNDEKNGQGCDIFPNGDRFEGTYNNGKREGKGALRFSNGSTYIG